MTYLLHLHKIDVPQLHQNIQSIQKGNLKHQLEVEMLKLKMVEVLQEILDNKHLFLIVLKKHNHIQEDNLMEMLRDYKNMLNQIVEYMFHGHLHKLVLLYLHHNKPIEIKLLKVDRYKLAENNHFRVQYIALSRHLVEEGHFDYLGILLEHLLNGNK